MLLLIAGASGTGKDTLLKAARARFADYPDVYFTRRCITREPDENEDNIPITQAEFEKALSEGRFLTHWRAHGNSYGILKSEIKPGVSVLSVSRTVAAFLADTENAAIAEITADKNIIAERLSARGRETQEQIENRISRYIPLKHKNVTVIDNSRDIKEAAHKLFSLIEKMRSG